MRLISFVLLCILQAIFEQPRCNSEPLPVVFWHGMGDHGTSGAIAELGDAIKEIYPSIYIRSIATSPDIIHDILDSWSKPIDEQVADVCAQLSADTKLKKGMNLIGFSQGGLFVRGLVQRCPGLVVNSLISLGGPHQGVFGLPHCDVVNFHTVCSFIRRGLSYMAYKPQLQKNLVQAQYWHDPLDESIYREASMFLADINQEKQVNASYRERIQKLERFVMVKFSEDTMVVPRDTSWFGFYASKSDDTVLDLRESPIYKEDRLGLQALDKAGKLKFIETKGDHLQFSLKWFKEVIVPLLG